MCEFKFKITMVGDTGVGKSALFSRYWKDIFPEDYKPTMVADSDVRLMDLAGRPGLVAVWDCSGNNVDYVVLRRVYKDSDGFIIVYDMTSHSSFRNVGFWLKELTDFGRKEANIMLVGTKSDEKEKRQVTQDEVYYYAEQHGLFFMETSAKTGYRVKLLFDNLMYLIYNRLAPQPSIDSEEADNGDRQQDAQEKADKEQSDGDVPA